MRDLLRRDCVNDYNGCLEVISTLNAAITCLYRLDSGTLSDDPFNDTSTVTIALEMLGFSEGYFSELADRLTLYRSVLCGDSVDWNKLVGAHARSDKEAAQDA